MVPPGLSLALTRLYEELPGFLRDGDLYCLPCVEAEDRDIANQIAGDLGFQTDVQVTSGVHEWVLQDNQTNWEFLQERAAIHARARTDVDVELVRA